MTLHFIKSHNNMLYTYFQRQSKYFIYIKELFIICRLLYNASIKRRSFASSFFCVFIFFFAFFFAFSFFCVFIFLRLHSLNYASSFSEICVFVLWNMRLRSSAKTKTMSTKQWRVLYLRGCKGAQYVTQRKFRGGWRFLCKYCKKNIQF